MLWIQQGRIQVFRFEGKHNKNFLANWGATQGKGFLSCAISGCLSRLSLKIPNTWGWGGYVPPVPHE